MSKKVALMLSGIIVLLSIVAGLVWWAIGFRSGAFQQVSASGFGMVLVLFAVVQVTGWAIVSTSLWVFQRCQRDLESWPVIVIAALLGLATILWGVTPVLGMPVVFAAIIGGTFLMIRVWRFGS
jgi:hypothetical protein